MYTDGLLIINEFKQDLVDNTFPQYAQLDKNIQQMIIVRACTCKKDILNLRITCKQMHDTIMTKINCKMWINEYTLWDTRVDQHSQRSLTKNPKIHVKFICKLLDNQRSVPILFDNQVSSHILSSRSHSKLWYSMVKRILQWEVKIQFRENIIEFFKQDIRPHLKTLDANYDELYQIISYLNVNSYNMCLLTGRYHSLYSREIKRLITNNLIANQLHM